MFFFVGKYVNKKNDKTTRVRRIAQRNAGKRKSHFQFPWAVKLKMRAQPSPYGVYCRCCSYHLLSLSLAEYHHYLVKLIASPSFFHSFLFLIAASHYCAKVSRPGISMKRWVWLGWFVLCCSCGAVCPPDILSSKHVNAANLNL